MKAIHRGSLHCLYTLQKTDLLTLTGSHSSQEDHQKTQAKKQQQEQLSL